jgi:nucleoid DNA-binding protein
VDESIGNVFFSRIVTRKVVSVSVIMTFEVTDQPVMRVIEMQTPHDWPIAANVTRYTLFDPSHLLKEAVNRI